MSCYPKATASGAWQWLVTLAEVFLTFMIRGAPCSVSYVLLLLFALPLIIKVYPLIRTGYQDHCLKNDRPALKAIMKRAYPRCDSARPPPSTRPLIWLQGALNGVEKVLPSFPPADFLGTGFPPLEARGKKGSIFTTLLLPD